MSFKNKFHENNRNFKKALISGFAGTDKYCVKELIINGIIAVTVLLVLIVEIVVIGIRGKYLMGAFSGTYPAFLWCPIGAGGFFAVGVCILSGVGVQKLLEVRRRKKYLNKSSKGVKPGLKAFDKKYTPVDEKKPGKATTFN